VTLRVATGAARHTLAMGDSTIEARAAPGEHLRPIVWLVLLLWVALLIRFAAVLIPGHSGDISILAGWAERMAQVGPGRVYDGILSVYPALLYVLWPLGILLDGQALDLVLKGLSIPFDLGLAVLIALVAERMTSPRRGLAAAALYLLNPAVLIAGPIWGQVDAAGTLAMLGSLCAAAGGRYGLAAALGTLAGTVKPQFGLVLVPVLGTTVGTAVRERRPGPALRALAAAGAVWVIITAPLALDPLRYWQQLRDVVDAQPFASLYAMNPWGLLLGFETPEPAIAPLGIVLLLGALAASLVIIRRRQDLPGFLAAGVVVVFAFYFLPTRSHERYLFPAMALLAPLAVMSVRSLAAYVVLSLAFALSLLYALVETTPFSLPTLLEATLTSSPAVWGIGLVIMASALAWIVIIQRRACARSGRAS
jgi:dolichyl-phosphate-mannose-protein mannosyltransferase